MNLLTVNTVNSSSSESAATSSSSPSSSSTSSSTLFSRRGANLMNYTRTASPDSNNLRRSVYHRAKLADSLEEDQKTKTVAQSITGVHIKDMGQSFEDLAKRVNTAKEAIQSAVNKEPVERKAAQVARHMHKPSEKKAQ
ncbi:MAG: hypothetical protein JWO53_965 [Chlamydiia bacterium]|nr:hypothetical protein [Chlamydiia bacterium]